MEMSPLECFRYIETAWREGRPIVPLLGAGISINAGIPSTTELSIYLAKVKYLFDRDKRLLLRGWPDVFAANSRLLRVHRQLNSEAEIQNLGNVITRSTEEVFWEEFRMSQPELARQDVAHLKPHVRADWRTLLRHVSGGNEALVDQFFDSLSNERRATKSHQFMAFLTQLIGWRLVLTTNFDDLLERTLREYGLRPEVFDATQEPRFPRAGLLQDKLAIVKLHGDRFSARLGDDFDYPFDTGSLDSFMNIATSDAIMLVLGYSGSDNRVMSLVERFAKYGEPLGLQHPPRILWVVRSRPSQQLMELSKKKHTLGRLRIIGYRDSDAFLQELYTRLRTAFPASRTDYRPLTQYPPQGRLESRRPADKPLSPFTLLNCERAGPAATFSLVEMTRLMEKTHRVIWCDLDEASSVDAIVESLMDRFLGVDRQLEPLVLSGLAEASASTEQRSTSAHGREARLSRIVEALSRGRYIVAIDCPGQIGRTMLKGNTRGDVAREAEEKVREVYTFLLDLAKRAAEFGESKVAAVLAPMHVQPIRLHAERTAVAVPSSTSVNEAELKTTEFRRWKKVETKDEIPVKVAGYPTDYVLGKGGQGIVVRINDQLVARHLVAKLPRPAVPLTPEALASFEREATVLARLNHPHIMPLYQFGMQGDMPFMIAPFYAGGSLRHRIRNKEASLAINETVRILSEVTAALAHAHAKQTCHRDVKPENIFFDAEGLAILGDFGLAWTSAAKNAQVQGTPIYNSPEQSEGDVVDWTLSDIFSLGIVFYEMLTGQRPFANKEAICSTDSPLPPSQLNKDVDDELENICMKCLEKKPNRRFSTADELYERLIRWQLDWENELVTKLNVLYAKHVELFKHGVNPGDASGNLRKEDTSREKDAHKQTCIRVIDVVGEPFVTETTPGALEAVLNVPAHAESLCNTVQGKIIDGEKNTLSTAVRILWPNIRAVSRNILALLSVFRRPRSVVALRRFAHIVQNESLSFSEFLALIPPVPIPPADTLHGQLAKHAADRQDERFLSMSAALDGEVAKLEKAGLLLRQEGGFVWMHTVARDIIYEMAVLESRSGVADLHESIAAYYYDDVYRTASDIMSFTEFLYHQLASIQSSPAEYKLRRCKRLVKVLNREKPTLIASANCSDLLEWILAIREEVIPTALFDEDMHRHEERDQLARLNREFESSLLDMEADIRRTGTDFHGCIRVRIRQINRCLQSLPGVTEFTILDFDSLLGGISSDSQYDALVKQLGEWLIRLGEIEHQENQLTRLQAIGELALDLANCLQGLHDSNALGFVEAVGEYVEKLAGVEQRPEQSEAEEKLAVLRTKVQLRIIDTLVSGVYTWDLVTPELDAQLSEALALYESALIILEAYPASSRGLYTRHNCYLKTHAARACYLLNQFDKAERLLDSAFAFVYADHSISGQLAQAVCEMRRAEHLMLYADKLLTGKLVTSEDHCVRMARQQLDLAKSSLRYGRELLGAQRAHVWLWTMLFLEVAQLQHERFTLSVEEAWLGKKIWGFDLDEMPHAEGMPVLTSDESEYIAIGLSAIAVGNDNISKDRIRREKFRILWWQLFFCTLLQTAERCGVEEDPFTIAWANWRAWNETSRSLWFFDQQESEFAASYKAQWDEIGGGFLTGDRSPRKRLLGWEKQILGPHTKEVNAATTPPG